THPDFRRSLIPNLIPNATMSANDIATALRSQDVSGPRSGSAISTTLLRRSRVNVHSRIHFRHAVVTLVRESADDGLGHSSERGSGKEYRSRQRRARETWLHTEGRRCCAHFVHSGNFQPRR